DTIDGLDCQIDLSGAPPDPTRWDLGAAHPLTGSIWINGAGPGDLLEVQLLDIMPGSAGWTIEVAGFGFLRDLFDEPFLVRWQMASGFAHSADLPGVRVPEASFPGVIGVSPSLEQMDRIITRERATFCAAVSRCRQILMLQYPRLSRLLRADCGPFRHARTVAI